jgi:hypothetical protein
MIISTFCRAAAILSAALFLTVSGFGAAIPPAENLLPADTMAFVTIPDFSQARADARQSPQWLFWNDPAMKPFHDKFVSGLNDALIGPLEADLGIQLSDFEDLPQGQLTLALSRNGWNGKEDSRGIIFLLDAGNKSDLLKTNLATLEKKWTDSGKTIRTQTVRGVPFSIVMISSNDVPGALTNLVTPRPQTQELGQKPETEKPHELVVGQFQSLLIAGNSIDAVDPIVAHLTGSQMPALSDDSTFAADKIAQFHGSPLYYAWFDAKTYFGILAATPPDQNPQAPTVFPPMQWDKVVTAMGVGGLKSICFSYYDTRAGAQANIFIEAPESTREGILKMFTPETRTAVPPTFVPADTTRFVRWRIDGQQAWKTLQDMLNNISPAGTAGLNALIDMANANAQQKNPGFDIRKSLFENLGDDFIRYEKPSAGSTPNPAGGPSLFLFKVNNGDNAVAAITTLASMGSSSEQKAPDPRIFQGHKIFTVPLPGAGLPRGPVAPQRFMYCSTSDGYVAVTADVSMLESYLRSAANPPKPLSGIPGLIDAAQHVGGTGNGMFGFQNQRELLRTLFKTLNIQSVSGLDAFGPMYLMPKELRNSMDFSLLPDYDAVSKYFYISVYAAASTPNGILFQTFAPRPPQLK